jgi:hypothetical protein
LALQVRNGTTADDTMGDEPPVLEEIGFNAVMQMKIVEWKEGGEESGDDGGGSKDCEDAAAQDDLTGEGGGGARRTG